MFFLTEDGFVLNLNQIMFMPCNSDGSANNPEGTAITMDNGHVFRVSMDDANKILGRLPGLDQIV